MRLRRTQPPRDLRRQHVLGPQPRCHRSLVPAAHRRWPNALLPSRPPSNLQRCRHLPCQQDRSPKRDRRPRNPHRSPPRGWRNRRRGKRLSPAPT
jgi:hypothetical protein